MMRFALLLVPVLASSVLAARLFVDPNGKDVDDGSEIAPFKTIQHAADIARPGDVVVIRDGLYREGVKLTRSGTRDLPIRFIAERAGGAIVTGADVIDGFSPMARSDGMFRVKWPHRFEIDKGREFHPPEAPHWGRAEQMRVDGKPLRLAGSLAELETLWSKRDTIAAPPLPNLGQPFVGAFGVDTLVGELYVVLLDKSDPAKHVVEASARSLLFGCNAYENKAGVQFIEVVGLVFRDAANFPQRAAVWLPGKNNLVEGCVIEDNAGQGINVNGAVRRCVIRNNGSIGGGAHGKDFVNENNLWEGNSWKPIDRGWETGGDKIAVSERGVYRDCLFRKNGGPGLWFDIDNNDIDVTHCVFDSNEKSGVFIEISSNIRVTECLMTGNALGKVGQTADSDWSNAGVQIGESEFCEVSRCTLIGNRDAIAIREQGPREFDGMTGPRKLFNREHKFFDNLLQPASGYPIALWYDNAFFGPHPNEKAKYPQPADWDQRLNELGDRVLDPARRGFEIDRNVYVVADRAKLMLIGVPWREKYRTLSSLATIRTYGGWETNGRVVDPDHSKSFAAGWKDAPADVNAWVAGWKLTASPAR